MKTHNRFKVPLTYFTFLCSFSFLGCGRISGSLFKSLINIYNSLQISWLSIFFQSLSKLYIHILLYTYIKSNMDDEYAKLIRRMNPPRYSYAFFIHVFKKGVSILFWFGSCYQVDNEIKLLLSCFISLILTLILCRS